MRDTLDGVIKLLKYTTLSFQSPISTNVAGRGMFTIVTSHLIASSPSVLTT